MLLYCNHRKMQDRLIFYPKKIRTKNIDQILLTKVPFQGQSIDKII